MNVAVAPLASILRLNTWLVLNCLDAVDDDVASRQVTPDTNSLAFLIAHVTDARHFLADLLGAPLENPVGARLQGVRGITDAVWLPALVDLRAAWGRISTHLDDVLDRLSPDELAVPAPQAFPGSDGTRGGALAFLVQHDTYHLGQMALLRRQLGLPAMSYGPPTASRT